MNFLLGINNNNYNLNKNFPIAKILYHMTTTSHLISVKILVTYSLKSSSFPEF